MLYNCTVKLFFTRHGESEANIRHIISNRNLPHALSESGRKQAAALAEQLRGELVTRIYSSPIPRAGETARILSSKLGAPLELADALCEPDCGILEGHSDDHAWAEHDAWMEKWLSARDLDRSPEGGETCLEVRQRFVTFVEALISLHDKSNAGFLLVTHGTALLIGLPALKGGISPQTILEFGLGPCALFTFDVQDGKLVWMNSMPVRHQDLIS